MGIFGVIDPSYIVKIPESPPLAPAIGSTNAFKLLENETNWKIEAIRLGEFCVTITDTYSFHALTMESAIKWLLKALEAREECSMEAKRLLTQRLRNVQSEIGSS